ncbi:hypothetical protein ENBRE01_2302 [Enteropsectra breve]|nr:hypothetical protein ENBRE01_2302 [Enteropsectra breve]
MHNNENDINKYITSNMATTQPKFPEFAGKEDEDVNKWIRDMLLITKLSGLDEPNTLKSFIFSLRGEALSWQSITRKTNTQVTLNQFIEEIRNRFSSKIKTDTIINRFLSIASAE